MVTSRPPDIMAALIEEVDAQREAEEALKNRNSPFVG